MINAHTPVFGSLPDRVSAALIGLALGLAGAYTPATAVAEPSSTLRPAAAWVSSATTATIADDLSATSFATFDAETPWCQAALQEIEVARRILGVLRDDLSPEFDAYLIGIEGALNRVPVRLDAASATALNGALGLARERLLADASSFRRWSCLVRAIDLGAAEVLRVPERFVVRLAPTSERSVVIDESEVRVDRAVREFFGV